MISLLKRKTLMVNKSGEHVCDGDSVTYKHSPEHVYKIYNPSNKEEGYVNYCCMYFGVRQNIIRNERITAFGDNWNKYIPND